MAGGDLTFRCYSCSRRFHWRDDLAGRTIRCACGVKFRCPDLTAQSKVAEESLEDTVADVSLNEALDDLSDPHGDEGSYEVGPVAVQPKGVLGLSPGGETLLWGAGVLLGVAFGLLALIVANWFYIACAVVLPIAAIKFRRAWLTWTHGRPWMQCLSEALGDRESA